MLPTSGCDGVGLRQRSEGLLFSTSQIYFCAWLHDFTFVPSFITVILNFVRVLIMCLHHSCHAILLPAMLEFVFWILKHPCPLNYLKISTRLHVVTSCYTVLFTIHVVWNLLPSSWYWKCQSIDAGQKGFLYVAERINKWN
jgi:hypothetical protein